jgi:glutamyl-tRNA synthetase
MVRTRFAPSPTGYLHIGGARTALFSWAYARKHKGTFVLRIEDTDLERSTEESVQAILDSMNWLGLDYDEGPFYQMQRMDRYKAVIQQLLDEDKAYYCYASKEELEKLREEQMAAGLKPRYDRRWRDSKATPPAGVQPVVRFKTPLDGMVVIDDMVKGKVVVQNSELDDLIIARSDGTPTYNFCVVVDDWDMNITHVIRGDDHLNNTPRQINILKALGAPLPQYAHVPMILGHDGERLSKRHGAVSVMQYQEDGYLPEALLNYLARLGWAKGDEEVFDLDQFVEWFDLDSISKSPAKFNPEKLLWLNQQYIKKTDSKRLSELVLPFLETDCCAAVYFYRPLTPSPELMAEHVTPEIIPVIRGLQEKLAQVEWNKPSINSLMKSVAAEYGLKFPKLAMPLRLLVTGETQTPSVDAVLELIGREETLKRISAHMP